MTKYIILAALVFCVISLLIFKNNEKPQKSSFDGCELTITCKGDVEETIYVQIISGELVEDFGVISSGPNGREGGATTGFGPFKVGEEVTVRWGVKGEDGLSMQHRKVFDTRDYLPYIDQIRAVEFIFHGGDKWELKVYDSNIADENKNEILPEENIKRKN